MRDDPYTLNIVLDANKRARGSLYTDDQESFDYREGKFKHIEFDFEDGSLSATSLYEGDFRTKSTLEKIVIVNPPKEVRSAILFSQCEFPFFSLLILFGLVGDFVIFFF